MISQAAVFEVHRAALSVARYSFPFQRCIQKTAGVISSPRMAKALGGG